MTNTPDAYTLAAQAAADRARAEAVQGQGTPGGASLQSPMRKLSKIPGARWVLSAVLLAAGSALAIDYLNTPLRAWLQYHAPVPGAGGNSIAEIAAKESAAPQAKIETEITQPAIAEARENTMEDGLDELKNRYTSPSTKVDDVRAGNAEIQFYALSPTLTERLKSGDWYLPSTIEDLDDRGSSGQYNFLRGEAQPMPTGKIVPLVFRNKTLATIKGRNDMSWLIVHLDDGSYGAITLDDYKRLSR